MEVKFALAGDTDDKRRTDRSMVTAVIVMHSRALAMSRFFVAKAGLVNCSTRPSWLHTGEKSAGPN